MGMVETDDEPDEIAGSPWDEMGRDMEDVRARCALSRGSRH